MTQLKKAEWCCFVKENLVSLFKYAPDSGQVLPSYYDIAYGPIKTRFVYSHSHSTEKYIRHMYKLLTAAPSA